MGSFRAFSLISSFFSMLLFHAVIRALGDSAALRGLGEVDTSVAYVSPIPLAASGSCTAEETYVVTSLQDLYDNASNLECIFAAGKQPQNVPLGFSYGYILAMANTGFFAPVAQIPYQGDYVVKTQCGGEFYNIGWMSIAGMDIGTASWTIDSLGWDLAAGEYPEGDNKSVLMDFTVDFMKLCAPEGNESPLGLVGFSPFGNSIFPVSAFKDLGRVVGVDTDGATILLNKALINSEGRGAQTVLLYAIKTFDQSVRPPGFVQGSSITVPFGPDGEKIINYKREGLDGLIGRTIGALADPTYLAREVAKREASQREQFIKRLSAGATSPFNPVNLASLFAHATGLLTQGTTSREVIVPEVVANEKS